MMDDLVGKTIGGYEVLRIIGEGGMARVYLARQQSMNRQVALKVLPRHFLNDDTYLQRFEREVKIVSQLEHRSIVPVYDYGEFEGQPYIVMRWMTAGSVDDLLRKGALPSDKILSIVAQVAPALDYAHSKDVLHRDLKPSNILMDDDSGAFITDFGIARITSGQGTAITTQGVVGTPSYMSPEQAQGKELDGRSDVYSLGVMLFEMATGRRPFENDTPYSIAVMQVTTPPPLPRTYNPKVSSALEAVILKSLRKEPAERYSTALELYQALKLAIENPLNFHDTEQNLKKPNIVQAPQQPQIIYPQPPQVIIPSPAVQNPVPQPMPQPISQPNNPPYYQTPQSYQQVQPSRALPAYSVPPRKKKQRANPLVSVFTGGAIGCGLLVIMAILGFAVVNALGLLPTPETRATADRVTLDTVVPEAVTDAPLGGGTATDATPIATLNPTAAAARETLLARSTQQVTPLPTPNSASPAMPAALQEAQGTLLYAGLRGEGSSASFEVILLDLATFQETLLTNDPSDDSYPAASPDGSRIVFQSDRDGDFEIYVMNRNGQNVVQLTDNDWVDRLAAWSPDGEWVIFSSDVRGDGNFDLYRVRNDGTGLEEVYTSAARKSHPRYSPDGRYVVFTSGSANDAATWEIMRLDTTTGEVLQMTNNSRRDASPLFSPNGSRILFITMMSDGSNNAIAEMNLDGTNAEVIYNSAGSDWSANYSPDGRYIVFASNLTGNDQIYLMTVDGASVQQVTTLRGGYPSWLTER